VHLYLIPFVVRVKLNGHVYQVVLVLGNQESVVDEECGVRFVAVSVADFIASRDIFESFDDKTIPFFTEEPFGLRILTMVEHIRVWHQSLVKFTLSFESK